MKFYDCFISYGKEIKASSIFKSAESLHDVEEALYKANINNALVSRLEHKSSGAVIANNLLANDMRDKENIHGVYSLLPTHTQEQPLFDELIDYIKDNNFAAASLHPDCNRFGMELFSLRDIYSFLQEEHIPIILNLSDGISYKNIYDIASNFPKLNIIFNPDEVWPVGRKFYPYLAEFANTYVISSLIFTDGIIEDITNKYGAHRMIYGSGFPEHYMFDKMLMILNAKIKHSDKEEIAYRSLERILGARNA